MDQQRPAASRTLEVVSKSHSQEQAADEWVVRALLARLRSEGLNEGTVTLTSLGIYVPLGLAKVMEHLYRDVLSLPDSHPPASMRIEHADRLVEEHGLREEASMGRSFIRFADLCIEAAG
jgi:hypothetical protein